MKTILNLIAVLFSTLTLQAQTVSTFSGHTVHYGWSSKSFSEKKLKEVLDKCFTQKTPELEIQQVLDEENVSAELLWKISGTLEQVTSLAYNKFSSSWIWDQAKPDGFTITFEPTGEGKIFLFQDKKLVGKVRCYTSNKREGDKYLQLKDGGYTVQDKDKLHIATEKDLKGAKLRHALYSGVEGKWIHEGESAPSHGCIRVAKPAMVELYRLIPVGIPFRVIWNG